MIIKKPAGYMVSDEIGRIFKEHNIIAINEKIT
jgi:hypothetical protein